MSDELCPCGHPADQHGREDKASPVGCQTCECPILWVGVRPLPQLESPPPPDPVALLARLQESVDDLDAKVELILTLLSEAPTCPPTRTPAADRPRGDDAGRRDGE